MKYLTVLSLCMLFHGALVQAQIPPYKGCEYNESDFSIDTLVSNRNDPTVRSPLQFVFDPVVDDEGYVDGDMYWVNRHGAFKRLRAGSEDVELLGEFEVQTSYDYGLLGLVLDPDFKENRWIYFWYSPPPKPEFGLDKIGNEMVLSRFILKEDGLDMSSERVIYKHITNVYKYQKAIWHMGGPMQFDQHGNLWFTYGNNSTDHNFVYAGSHVNPDDSILSDEWGSSNTASARGSILRIKPIPFPDSEIPEWGVGRTYEVPEGGFGDYFSQYWKDKGEDGLAERYLDTGFVRPEIYIKGFRSIFSVNVDPYFDYVSWGEINPSPDEHFLVKHPVYSGYPYYAGWRSDTELMKTSGHDESMEAPINDSPLSSGVQRLPHVTYPTLPNAYSSAHSAMAGGIYYYDGQLKSRRKMPPHFNGKWFVTDYMKAWKYVIDVDTSGPEITYVSGTEIFPNVHKDPTRNSPLEIEFGPDGALYIGDYGMFKVTPPVGMGMIIRFSYHGTCQDPDLIPPQPIVAVEKKSSTPEKNSISLTGGKLSVTGAGRYDITIRDLQGSILHAFPGEGRKTYDLSKTSGLSRGLYLLTLESETGMVSRKVVF